MSATPTDSVLGCSKTGRQLRTYLALDQIETMDTPAATLNQLADRSLKITVDNLQVVQASVYQLVTSPGKPMDELNPTLRCLVSRDLKALCQGWPFTSVRGPLDFRDLKSDNDTYTNLSKSCTNYLPALVGQIHPSRTVLQGNARCTNCQTGHRGRFKSCVVLRLPLIGTGSELGLIDTLMRGSCANCAYKNGHRGCSLSELYEGRAVQKESKSEVRKPIMPVSAPPLTLRGLRRKTQRADASKAFKIDLPSYCNPVENWEDLQELVDIMSEVKRELEVMLQMCIPLEDADLINVSQPAKKIKTRQ